MSYNFHYTIVKSVVDWHDNEEERCVQSGWLGKAMEIDETIEIQEDKVDS